MRVGVAGAPLALGNRTVGHGGSTLSQTLCASPRRLWAGPEVLPEDRLLLQQVLQGRGLGLLPRLQGALLRACQPEVEIRAEEEPLGERRHGGGFGSSFSML